MTTVIPLTKGMSALVDDEDADLVGQFRWYPLKGTAGVWYALRVINGPQGQRTHLLHQFLTGWPLTDHISGDGLDNRRANLRPATHEENGRNRRKSRNCTSQYKGVHWSRGLRRWVAQIYLSERDCNGQNRQLKIHLGCFTDEDAAARAYDAAARVNFGEFAALNFPQPGETSALIVLGRPTVPRQRPESE